MIIGIDASRANSLEKTGTEFYSWYVIRELVRQHPEQQFRLYTREPLRGGLEGLGPNVEARVLTWRPGLLWSHLRLSWELFWHRPDLLFVPADTVPLYHSKKTITTIHDVAFERWPEVYRGRSVQRKLGWLRPLIHLSVRIFTLGRYSASERDYHRWSVRHALRSSQCILTVSHFSKREILATLPAAKQTIIVTPLGVRQGSELPDCAPEFVKAVQDKFKVTNSYFLFVGRLEEKKNIRLLLESYVSYRQRGGVRTDLVLIGAPGLGWEQAYDAVPLEHRQAIHRLGWVGETERWRLHAGARGLVFLSAYEGFGLPPLESLALGVPVLASRAGSLPEVLGASVLYADHLEPSAVATQIEQLDLDTDLRQRLIETGHSWVQQYTWANTARQTWEAFTLVEPRLAKEG